MAITLEQLNAFVKAAELGSFSAAAKALGKAQPAISMAIANLEETLGAELFDRSSRRSTLTPQGEALINNAQAVLAQTQALHTKVSSAAPTSPFTLIVDPTLPLAPLAHLARQFNQQFPGTQLNILTGGAGDTAQDGNTLWVIDKQDSAFIAAPGSHELESSLEREDSLEPENSHERKESHELEDTPVENNKQLHPIGAWPLDIVAAPIHPLTEVAGELTSEHLNQYTQLILHPDDAEAEQPTQQVEDSALLLKMVVMGLGWARLPRLWVSDSIRQSTLTRLGTANGQSALEVIGVLREQSNSEAATAQANWVLDALQKIWR